MRRVPRNPSLRTEAQQSAITAISQRNLVKTEAVAFYDVIWGREPDALSGQKIDKVTKQPCFKAVERKDGTTYEKPIMHASHYWKCYSYAQAAWKCFQTGERPLWSITRNAIYQRYETKLKEIGTTYLSALASGTTATVPIAVSVTPKEQPKAAGKPRKKGSSCELCGIDCDGKFCSQCRERLDEYAALLAARGPMTANEIDAAIGEDAEDSVLRDLQSDERFSMKDGKWTLASPTVLPAVGPASPRPLAGGTPTVREDDIDPFADEAEAAWEAQAAAVPRKRPKKKTA